MGRRSWLLSFTNKLGEEVQQKDTLDFDLSQNYEPTKKIPWKLLGIVGHGTES